MTPGEKDGLAVAFLVAWGVGCLLVRPDKTLRLLFGKGWYER